MGGAQDISPIYAPLIDVESIKLRANKYMCDTGLRPLLCISHKLITLETSIFSILQAPIFLKFAQLIKSLNLFHSFTIRAPVKHILNKN